MLVLKVRGAKSSIPSSIHSGISSFVSDAATQGAGGTIVLSTGRLEPFGGVLPPSSFILTLELEATDVVGKGNRHRASFPEVHLPVPGTLAFLSLKASSTNTP